MNLHIIRTIMIKLTIKSKVWGTIDIFSGFSRVTLYSRHLSLLLLKHVISLANKNVRI